MGFILNIAAYKFVNLFELECLKVDLKKLCKNLELKGSILLSLEGINLFIAGAPHAVEQLIFHLHSVPGLEDLEPKKSRSNEQPFNRMLVKIKREIISFGVDGIDPARRSSPRISARELKDWLDHGKPFTLLDTRNDYEVKLGTFNGAVKLGIDHFRKFPDALRSLPESMKDTPVVTFCTGGIRCEKAAPKLGARPVPWCHGCVGAALQRAPCRQQRGLQRLERSLAGSVLTGDQRR